MAKKAKGRKSNFMGVAMGRIEEKSEEINNTMQGRNNKVESQTLRGKVRCAVSNYGEKLTEASASVSSIRGFLLFILI